MWSKARVWGQDLQRLKSHFLSLGKSNRFSFKGFIFLEVPETKLFATCVFMSFLEL